MPSLLALKCDTVRTLMRDFLGLDPRLFTEYASSSASRSEAISRSEPLKLAVAEIVKATEVDVEPYVLSKPDEDGTHTTRMTKATKRSLERMIATVLFLILDTRLSRAFHKLDEVEEQAFDAEWMEPFGNDGEVGDQREALFAISPMLMEYDEKGPTWRCVQKATVILEPVENEHKDERTMCTVC